MTDSADNLIYLLYLLQHSIDTAYIAELHLTIASACPALSLSARAAYSGRRARPELVVLGHVAAGPHPPPLLFSGGSCIVAAKALGRGVVGGGGSCCCGCFGRGCGGCGGRQVEVLPRWITTDHFLDSVGGKRKGKSSRQTSQRGAAAGNCSRFLDCVVLVPRAVLLFHRL